MSFVLNQEIRATPKSNISQSQSFHLKLQFKSLVYPPDLSASKLFLTVSIGKKYLLLMAFSLLSSVSQINVSKD